jgi:predicted secreted acid phosphatase
VCVCVCVCVLCCVCVCVVCVCVCVCARLCVCVYFNDKRQVCVVLLDCDDCLISKTANMKVSSPESHQSEPDAWKDYMTASHQDLITGVTSLFALEFCPFSSYHRV